MTQFKDQMKKVSLVILGVGAIGRKLLDLLISREGILAQRNGVSFEIALMADSSALVQTFCDPTLIPSLIQYKADGKSFADLKQSQPLVMIQKYIPPGSIVIDTSASESTAQIVCDSLLKGCKIVLANKKPLTMAQDVFKTLFKSPQSFRNESTVGAGTPICTTLSRLLNAADTIHHIEGCLSGTLGYLTSQMEEGLLFSEIVRKAHQLGYTEPDPRDDLGGVDVARKVLILARMAGMEAELSDVEIEPLYSESMGKLEVEAFMKELPQMDSLMKEKIDHALESNCVLRYVGVVDFEKNKISARLQAVPRSSPLGALKGSDNMVTFTTDTYASSPLVVQGAGSGALVTACGVLADIIELCQYIK